MVREFASERMAPIPKTSVWAEFTPLAQQCNAVNLGQGFPNFHPDEFVLKSVTDAVAGANALNNQYCRTAGHPALTEALGKFYSAAVGKEIDHMKEICVLNGCTQALNCTMMTMLNPGDEVIIFEPFFDLYVPDINLAGGKAVPVPLIPGGYDSKDWVLDEGKVRSAITKKTKAMLINTPQNAPGKVFSKAELEMLARIAIEHDLFVVTDEVYEQITFDGCEHVMMASIPGMFERTISLGSSGKTFSCTGFKIGWAIAPENIITAMIQVHSQQAFSVATPLQIGVANALNACMEPNNTYLKELKASYHQRREMMMNMLNEAGLKPIKPQGSYFVVADIGAVDDTHFYDPKVDVGKDWQFCRWLCKEIGVGAIPMTAFCTPQNRPVFENYVRFAFCKTNDSMVEGAKRLLKIRNFLRK